MDNFEKVVKQLYPEKSNWIISQIKEYCKKVNPKKNPAPNYYWYKYASFYFIYPDSIRTKDKSPLLSLIPHLQYVKNLGCRALHILPFLESPMVDKGFDISHFCKVRSELGNLDDVKKVVQEAQKLGIKLFMDLVFNHVSDQHEWFKKAESGDEKFRHYFIHQKTKPDYRGRFHKESAVWATYIVNGKKRKINIAFPEYTGDIAHWRQGEDEYWYYHTYYPEQIDINWRNPEVFLEFAKIVIFWSDLGFNFRLDAIPFVGKSAYKESDNNTSFTRNLLAAFSTLASVIDPETTFIVETYEKEDTVIDYFGSTNFKQAQLAYNFHLCTYIWVALVTKNANFIWEKLNKEGKIPVHGEWINFLRNHDELSLAHLDENLLKKIFNALIKNGAPFREGYGISGRTYSLLNKNERRFLASYFLLSCLPGGMLIPFGDEVGKLNTRISRIPKNERKDTRNINRGYLTLKELNSKKGQRIFSKMQEFLKNRHILREYLNIWPKKIEAPSEVFAGVYEAGSSKLYVLVNLSPSKQIVKIDTTDLKIIAKLFGVKVKKNSIQLSSYSGMWLQR